VGRTADLDVFEKKKTFFYLPGFEFLTLEDNCITFFRNVGKHSPDTPLHLRTPESSDNHKLCDIYFQWHKNPKCGLGRPHC